MADFSAVLRKTLDGMANPTPEMRAKVYERARATITRQIEAMPSRPPEAAVERQFKKLDEAIAELEAGFAAETEAAPNDDLDHLFADPADEKAAAAPEQATPAPAADTPPSPPAEEKPAATPERADPLEAFLAEQESESVDEMLAEPKVPDMPATEPEPRSEPELQVDRDGREGAAEPLASTSRGRGGLIAALILLVVLAGGAYAAYVNQDRLLALFQGEPEVVTETNEDGIPVRTVPSTTVTAEDTVTEPETSDETPPTETALANTDGADETADGPEKFTQRLTADGNEVDAGPASGADGTGEGTTVAGQTVEGDPAASEGGIEEPAATDQPDPGLPVGQRAIFYQERTGSQPGTAEAGATVWSMVQESPGGDAPPEPAVRAEASIPELGLTMEMTIRRNIDETFPASHMIELFFRAPETFEGRGIADVQRITFKSTEQDPGNALIGVAAPLETNIFLIALTDADTAIETNIGLMQRQEWIDIPMQYVSGRRALITLEKGLPGAKVFDEVIAAWGQATPASDAAVDGEGQSN
jgi:hypothetical protein